MATKKNFGKKKSKMVQEKLPIYALSSEEIAKLTTEDLFREDPVDLYIAIHEGKVQKFPDKYWVKEDPEYINRVKAILNYLFTDVLRWNKYAIEEEISCSVFRKHKLIGLYDSFNSSTINILNTITDYEYSAHRLKCYNRKISQVRRDLEWFMKKLICKGLIKTTKEPIPLAAYQEMNVSYLIDFKYFKPESTIDDILTNLHPTLLNKYFTLKGDIRKGLKLKEFC